MLKAKAKYEVSLRDELLNLKELVNSRKSRESEVTDEDKGVARKTSRSRSFDREILNRKRVDSLEEREKEDKCGGYKIFQKNKQRFRQFFPQVKLKQKE